MQPIAYGANPRASESAVGEDRAEARPDLGRSLLSGRVAVITGGGSGIGRATALLMARERAAAIVIAGRRSDAGEQVVRACRAAGSEALYIQTDVSKDDQIARLVETTLARFGRLDVAFNNAGFQEPRALIDVQDTNLFDRVFDTNVRSVFLCLRNQIPAMLKSGGGSIVINTSVSGKRNPNPGLALYSASKAAAISLTRSAAMEFGPQGVRINAIAPGRVVTDMMLGSGIADMSVVAAGLPLRRMGYPEEVAEAVVWLASDAASYVVGHVLAADGGFSAS
jgi:NAD(P)-dependent dehydrogenase (short-subunit alcohol dehydrogenase family)